VHVWRCMDVYGVYGFQLIFSFCANVDVIVYIFVYFFSWYLPRESYRMLLCFYSGCV